MIKLIEVTQNIVPFYSSDSSQKLCANPVLGSVQLGTVSLNAIVTGAISVSAKHNAIGKINTPFECVREVSSVNTGVCSILKCS